MTLGRKLIWGATGLAISMLLVAGCSEERKREAARLENELKGDTTAAQTLAAKDSSVVTDSSVPQPLGSVKDTQTTAAAPESTIQQSARDTQVSVTQDGALTQGSSTRSTTTTEPVADVNAVPEESGTKGVTTQKPAVVKTDQQISDPGMPPQPHDGFTIQVGSSPSEAYANETVKSYVDQGFQAYVATGTVEGKTYYRIRIGFYATSAEAKMALGDIKAKLGVDGWVDPITR